MRGWASPLLDLLYYSGSHFGDAFFMLIMLAFLPETTENVPAY